MTSANRTPAILTVSLKAITENYKKFKSMTDATVAGVIKADGYGAGAKEIHAALHGAGCGIFFVATPDEAAAIRENDAHSEIIVLGGLYEGAEDFYAGRGIIPALNSMDDTRRWSELAEKLDTTLPAVLHFDTGMNRLGLAVSERPDTSRFDLRFIMSHFACADEKGHPMNERQATAFEDIAQHYKGVPKSLCNSSGMFRSKSWHYDLVRPGYALYGGNPVPEAINPMQPAVSLKTRILQTRDVKAGESAGYNATHIFSKATQVATVALGYADGFLRSASNSAKLYWNGAACPIVGRVSMDLVIVDIGDLPQKPVAGEWLEVIGPHQSVDDLAKDCRTIGYEILTSLGSRYHRVYES